MAIQLDRLAGQQTRPLVLGWLVVQLLVQDQPAELGRLAVLDPLPVVLGLLMVLAA